MERPKAGIGVIIENGQDNITLIEVTPSNVLQETLFCIKDVKSPAFENKKNWFTERYNEGLRLKILKDNKHKPIAFIEYIPARLAWRPVDAPDFMFIHCMYVYSNKDKKQGYGSVLVKSCEDDAQAKGLHGVCVMTSKGSWLTDKRLFEKNGYLETDQADRFELMVKKFRQDAPDPKLIDWTKQQDQYKGWHLHYADQCPWHEKSVQAIKEVADEKGLNLQIRKITSAEEAKNAPSGFGTFSLLKDGKLLADHYISQTRFRNILGKVEVED